MNKDMRSELSVWLIKWKVSIVTNHIEMFVVAPVDDATHLQY